MDTSSMGARGFFEYSNTLMLEKEALKKYVRTPFFTEIKLTRAPHDPDQDPLYSTFRNFYNASRQWETP